MVIVFFSNYHYLMAFFPYGAYPAHDIYLVLVIVIVIVIVILFINFRSRFSNFRSRFSNSGLWRAILSQIQSCWPNYVFGEASAVEY